MAAADIQHGQERLDQRFTPLLPDSTDPIYRVSPATPEHLLTSNPTLQPRQGTLSLPENLVWRDLTEQEAEQCVIDGQSLLVLGAPGVSSTSAGRNSICQPCADTTSASATKSG